MPETRRDAVGTVRGLRVVRAQASVASDTRHRGALHLYAKPRPNRCARCGPSSRVAEKVGRLRGVGSTRLMHTSFFKAPQSAKIARALKSKERKQAEQGQMRAVRRRDTYCRFPLCGCSKFRLRLEVSHQTHRGMGGNPAGDRSHRDRLVLVCSARHREHGVSIDRGTLRWREIARDANGRPLIAWEVDRRALELGDAFMGGEPEWMELARETALHSYEPFTGEQGRILRLLAVMRL